MAKNNEKQQKDPEMDSSEKKISAERAIPIAHTRFTPPQCEGVHTGSESPVQQHFQEESDINSIVGRYDKTGVLASSQGYGGVAKWGDFSNVQTLQQAQDGLIKANEAFMALPSKIRDRFQNDPKKLVDFCSNPENKKEAQFLGILPDDQKPKPTEVPKTEEKIPKTEEKPAKSD